MREQQITSLICKHFISLFATMKWLEIFTDIFYVIQRIQIAYYNATGHIGGSYFYTDTKPPIVLYLNNVNFFFFTLKLAMYLNNAGEQPELLVF
jgi:hypothetical protein